MSKLVLRADAVAFAAFGVLLLLAPWNDLYELLGLPRASPELWTQLAGLLLLAFAHVLWLAPRSGHATQLVALAGAIANVGAAAVIATWLARGLDVDTVGSAVLWLVAVVSAAFGAVEAWIASRSVAILVPGD